MSNDMPEKMPVFEAAEVERRLLNDAELVKMVLHAFMEDLPRQIEHLKEVCAQSDTDAIERQAHSIKGACANVGALYTRDLARNIEKAARSASPDQLAMMVDALEATQEPLYTALQDYLAST
ncbi:MAG: Hpt domain-containing protein [Desulfuromonadaceae bacterium]